jgi:hypothetical protein
MFRNTQEPVDGAILALDIPSPKPWRRLLPRWVRSLVWLDSAKRYDAFLSYSWQADLRVAPVIQSTIQNFLRPWYKTRAKTIFRDLSCLPAGSSLERELLVRLDRSHHLIVLACPEAALSRGMELEIRHWCSRDRDGQILVIVTRGDCKSWDDVRKHLLPPTARDRLRAEPLWVSIEHQRSAIQANPNDPSVRGQLVEVLRQVLLRFYPTYNWEELCGQERFLRRRVLGLMSAIVLLLLFLSAAAVGFAWYADRQRRIAESRQGVAESQQLLSWNSSAALRRAVEAGHRWPTEEAEMALTSALNHAVTRFVFPRRLGVKYAGLSGDGKRIVIADGEGVVQVHDMEIGRVLHQFKQNIFSNLFCTSMSPDDSRLIYSDLKTAVVWDTQSGRQLTKLAAATCPAAFSADKKLVAATATSLDGTAQLWDATTGQHLRTLVGNGGWLNTVIFLPGGTRIITADDKTARMWDTSTGRL